MAGFFLVGVPLVLGCAGGTVAQFVLRRAGVPLSGRVACETALVGLGVLGIYTFPPGGANTGKNWDKWFMNATFVVTGAVAMFEGALVNLIQFDDTTTQTLAGVAVAAAAVCWYRERRRRQNIN